MNVSKYIYKLAQQIENLEYRLSQDEVHNHNYYVTVKAR